MHRDPRRKIDGNGPDGWFWKLDEISKQCICMCFDDDSWATSAHSGISSRSLPNKYAPTQLLRLNTPESHPVPGVKYAYAISLSWMPFSAKTTRPSAVEVRMNSNKQAITLEKGQDGAGSCPCAHLHEAARPQLQKWDVFFRFFLVWGLPAVLYYRLQCVLRPASGSEHLKAGLTYAGHDVSDTKHLQK